MRREGTPAWMQAVKRRLEQAAEEARNRPAKAGIPPFRHSGEGRNPVVYKIHSRNAGMSALCSADKAGRDLISASLTG